MTNELTLGSIGISVLLSILLRMIYGTLTIPNKAKPWIAVVLGVGLAIVALFVASPTITIGVVVTYVVQGFMVGATATGLYEMTKKQT
jgi:hypothetical protein